MIDNLFLFAVGALGWGLSLTTYSFFARRRGWPMGAVHTDFPALPVVLGVLAIGFGLWFVAERGLDQGGWIILLFGFLLAVFWTGFLRVGSQVSLLLAPIATVFLVVGWLGAPLRQDATWSGRLVNPTTPGSIDDDRPIKREK